MNLQEYRKKMFLTAYPMKTAHLASAFSIAEIMFVLYKKILRFDVNNPKWEDRDRFVLSKGHASLAQYVVMQDVGIISNNTLKTFCKPGKSIGGEINPDDCAGVETATGSLGHGLGFAVGQAIALKMRKSPARVFCVVGNGELNEGVVWESVMSAHKFELDNLIVILDDNKLQKMGYTKDTMKISSWSEKFEAFGWEVATVDGHNIEEIEKELKKRNKQTLPKIIVANTVKGKGVSLMENNPIWHFKMPSKRELEIFIKELNISAGELLHE